MHTKHKRKRIERIQKRDPIIKQKGISIDVTVVSSLCHLSFLVVQHLLSHPWAFLKNREHWMGTKNLVLQIRNTRQKETSTCYKLEKNSVLECCKQIAVQPCPNGRRVENTGWSDGVDAHNGDGQAPHGDQLHVGLCLPPPASQTKMSVSLEVELPTPVMWRWLDPYLPLGCSEDSHTWVVLLAKSWHQSPWLCSSSSLAISSPTAEHKACCLDCIHHTQRKATDILPSLSHSYLMAM